MIATDSKDDNIYATPDIIVHSTTNIPGDTFNGECYASTYQTNGEAHFYQELSEANPLARAKSMAMSREGICPKPHLPLRMTMSSASVSKFPLPYTPAPAYSDVVKKPSMPEAPYLISRPSISSTLKSTASSHPYLVSRPSTVNISQTPDITPVRF